MQKNHYGVTIDSDKPVTGVIGNNSAEYLAEESHNGIDLGYEDYMEQARAEHVHSPKEKSYEVGACHVTEHGCTCEDGEECECTECETCDEIGEDYEDQGEGTYLVGTWKPTADGKYEPDTSGTGIHHGGYAGIYRAGSNVTQVVWSRYASRAALCSPCYPGQADLDTAGDFLAYTLPPDMFSRHDTHLEIIELPREAELA